MVSYPANGPGWGAQTQAQGGESINREVAATAEQLEVERRQDNRKRRRRMLGWCLSAFVVVLLLVALMIYLWSTELFVAVETADQVRQNL